MFRLHPLRRVAGAVVLCTVLALLTAAPVSAVPWTWAATHGFLDVLGKVVSGLWGGELIGLGLRGCGAHAGAAAKSGSGMDPDGAAVSEQSGSGMDPNGAPVSEESGSDMDPDGAGEVEG